MWHHFLFSFCMIKTKVILTPVDLFAYIWKKSSHKYPGCKSRNLSRTSCCVQDVLVNTNTKQASENSSVFTRTHGSLIWTLCRRLLGLKTLQLKQEDTGSESPQSPAGPVRWQPPAAGRRCSGLRLELSPDPRRRRWASLCTGCWCWSSNPAWNKQQLLIHTDVRPHCQEFPKVQSQSLCYLTSMYFHQVIFYKTKWFQKSYFQFGWLFGL